MENRDRFIFAAYLIDKLGLEFASGWDILNVAGALSRPKWLSERLRKSTLSFTAADERPLYTHTNLFDRCLARLLTILGVGSVVAFSASVY